MVSVIIVLLIMGLALILIGRRALRQQIFRVQRKTAEQVALSISSYLQSAKDDLVALAQAQDWSKLSRDEKKQAMERFWLERQEIYEEIAFLDRAGTEAMRISRSHTYLPEELGSQAHTSAFQRAVAGERFLAEEISISPDSGLPVVEIAVPVSDPSSGNSVGVLLAQVSIKQMWSAVTEVEVGESGYVYVINRAGRMLAHSNLARYLNLRDEKLSDVPAVERVRFGLEEVAASQYEGLDSDSVVGAFAPIEDTYWFTIVELPTAEAYATIQRMVATWLGLMVATVLVIGGLTSWLPQRIVRRPLAELEEGAALLSRGELEHRITLHTGDELEALGNTFNEMASHLQELYTGLERTVDARTHDLERRAIQLEAAAEVARDAVAIRDVDQLLDETVQLISEQFGFYHAGIFLLDDAKKYAILEAVSSEGGRRMLKRGHKLQVGQVGIVGYVAGAQEPRIALDVGEDAVFFDNPDMPNTRSEMALPLEIRGEVIGVLDVQSVEAEAFDEEDVAILRTVADQLAVAIENARLLEESQRAVRELEAAQGEHLRAAWKRFGQLPAFEYDRVGVKPTDAASIPVADRALSEGRVVAVTEDGDGRSALAAPLRLRDQVIGALSLEETDEARPWTEDEVELLEEVSEQVALALENARLFGEARTRAQELAVLNELSQSLTSRNDVEGVLEETFQGASRLLDTANFYIALYDDETQTVSFPLAFDAGQRVQWRSREMGKGLTEYIIHSQQPVLVREDMPKWLAEKGIETVGPMAPSWMGVPLKIGDRVLGVMAIQSYDTPRAYDERELELLTAIASQTAIALESARLFEETQEEAQRRALINEVLQAASTSLEPEAVLRQTGAIISQRLEMPTNILMWDPEEHALQPLTAHDYTGAEVTPSEDFLITEEMNPVMFEAIRTRQLQILLDVPTHTYGAMSRMAQRFAVQDAAYVPLTARDRVIGILALGRQPGHPPIDEGSLSFIQIVGANLSVALENARLYEEAVETAQRLREVDKLKSEFLANMSHELRTPLNSIIGFSRVILKGIDGPLNDRQQQDLEAIYGSGQHLLGLINDILDISKIEAGKMELNFSQVNLADVVGGVMSTAIALVKDKPVDLQQSIPDDLPLITADERRVRQVLLNLVSNAAKFTNEGFVHVEAQVEGPNVLVSVSDTGAGIPEDKLDEMFEAFTQLDSSSTREHEGTGLGLTITRSFVDLHGGEVWAESKVGVGSTFYFTLPIEGAPPEKEEEEEGQTHEESPKPSQELDKEPKALVLCVDDDEGVIKLFRRYLSQQGYQIVGLTDANQVVAEAKRLQPHAITLDVMMPEKDGWQVIRELKDHSETSHIPVIMCTIVGDEDRGISLGASDYLVKPIMEQELVTALDRLDREDGNHKVLVVDDQPKDRDLLRQMIASQGEYEVIEAGGGEEAIALVRNARPDIIILDLMMPVVDGFAVLESVKADEATRSIPIIVVTAKELTVEDRRRLNSGIETLIQKGLLEQEELLEDVARALRKLERTS